MSSERDADLVVCGASFAGLAVVRHLLRMRPRFAGNIAVVDRAPRQVYIPLVHEWLTDRIAPDRAEIDVEGYLTRHAGVRFVHGEIAGLDPVPGRVRLSDGRGLTASAVVVAVGSVLAPPEGMPGAEHFVRYKLTDEAAAAKARLSALRRRDRSRVVVAGGGISGVELAAELAFTARAAGASGHEVRLIVRGARVLEGFKDDLAARVETTLRDLGVEIRHNTEVVGAEVGAVHLEGPAGRCAPSCDAVVWAAGVRPAPVLGHLGLDRTHAGFVRCDPGLLARPADGRTGIPVFACGDAVTVVGPDGNAWPTMRRAVECLWQAGVVARNVAATFEADAVCTPARHRLRRSFPYGISAGPRSFVVAGSAYVDVPRFGIGLRRLLMALYRRRFAP